jgi:CheY-like chemotaxis protein
MMGRRSPQDKLFAADHVYLDFVGRDTLYGYMAQNREQLFRDEDFAALYCPDNGRQSVPPSLAVSLLFLRAYEGVSFAEAVERTKYDLRWKVALGLEMEEVAMQKSALQEFEAKLVLHEMEEPILKKSIEEARRRMSGLELQTKLNAEHCRIPTIFITAHGDTKMRMQALRAGAVEFLAKPFDDESLLSSVRAALES